MADDTYGIHLCAPVRSSELNQVTAGAILVQRKSRRHAGATAMARLTILSIQLTRLLPRLLLLTSGGPRRLWTRLADYRVMRARRLLSTNDRNVTSHARVFLIGVFFLRHLVIDGHAHARCNGNS